MSIIFDTETTGLPACKQYGFFPLYNNTKAYENARVVQVSYILTDKSYRKLEESDTIIKMDNFRINNSKFHGITEEISMSKGVPFEQFAKQFSNSLDCCHTLIAHNLSFDFNVLCAELYRYNLTDIIAKMESKRQICTMKYYKNMVRATFKNSTDIKDPNLKELYYYATGEEMENHHNSMYDTLNLWKSIMLIESKMDLID
jgi:DNA polymerase-3 subunit alpha